MFDFLLSASAIPSQFRWWITSSAACWGLLFSINDLQAATLPEALAGQDQAIASKVGQQLIVQADPQRSASLKTYDQLMQAGYEATQQRDYPSALGHFQAALLQRPNNTYAQLAISNVTHYVYNQSMQEGYSATQQKQYSTALVHFQQALEQRPDDDYAQQAIQNVETFLLAQGDAPPPQDSSVTPNHSPATPTPNSNGTSGPSLLWLIFGIGGLFAGLIGIVLFILSSRRRSLLEQALIEAEQAHPPEEEVMTQKRSTPKETSKTPNTENPLEHVTSPPPISTEPKPVHQDSSSPLTPPHAQPTANGALPFQPPGAPQVPTPETTPINSHNISGKTPPLSPSTALSVTQPKPTEENDLPIQRITRLPAVDVISELITDLEAPDLKTRRKAIWELARKGDSRAMKPLLELMIDSDSHDRSLVLEALSQISARTLKPMNQAISLSLQDTNAQVRKNAIRDLTRIYELMAQISRRLSLAADDPDEEVQATARWALSQLNEMRMPSNLDSASPPSSQASPSANDLNNP